jgi:DNA polymerase alpha subunit A
LITKQGRDILQATVQRVQNNLQLEIVYGDTDSIMVNTNTDQLGDALKIGNKIKAMVNKDYKYLEIETGF